MKETSSFTEASVNSSGSSSDVDGSLPRYRSTIDAPREGLHVQGYEEDVIGVKDYLGNLVRDPGHRTVSYLRSIFPILNWIGHYPFHPGWIYSDIVAGLTVAVVLVPQGMSYAQLATLSPEYGLYSSFIGLLIYSFFATSKDVSIGPVAVMSMEIGKIIQRVQSKVGEGVYEGHTIATTLALLCGAICLGIGLLRIGFLVELIPLPAVLAFMSGSAFNIMCGQVPGLMGFNRRVNTRDSTYLIVIHTLQNLHRTKVDAAFGLVPLFILYAWKFAGAKLYQRYPNNKFFFYIQHVRAAVVIIFATLISYLILRGQPHTGKAAFSIVGHIQSGLGHVERFVPPKGLPADLASELPVATIILVLEHISIAKSFGRINDYKINPNQEFIAIGVTNLIGTFFHAYPATGSFSRTALKSKCGVRTPFAGIFAGSAVLIAIYCLTSTFYYIPRATLCAIIIHAVSDLIPSYKVTWNMFKVSPVDCGIFLIGLLITVFSSIENGIYFAVAAAAAQVLWRLCITNGTFLGRVKVVTSVAPVVHTKDSSVPEVVPSGEISTKTSSAELVSHYKWVPLPNHAANPSKIHTRYINNNINVVPPPPGVIVYRLSESFIYPNCSRQADAILDEIKATTRNHKANREATWNNPGPLIVRNPFKKYDDSALYADDQRPDLKVLHLDFSQVVAADATSVQALVDLKKAIEVHSGPNFQINFSGIINPWVVRALVNGGFGGEDIYSPASNETASPAKTSDLESGLKKESDTDPDDPLGAVEEVNAPQRDLSRRYVETGLEDGRLLALQDVRHPHFYLDIPAYTEFDV